MGTCSHWVLNGHYLVEGSDSDVDQVMIKVYRIKGDHLVEETFVNRNSSQVYSSSLSLSLALSIDLVTDPYEDGEKLGGF